MLQIWGGATARTIRPHWMCHELALEYEPKLIGSRTGETQSAQFRALNPKEKIPVMVDGDLVLSESAAIVTYLGDTYGPDTGLVPPPFTTERARAGKKEMFLSTSGNVSNASKKIRVQDSFFLRAWVGREI